MKHGWPGLSSSVDSRAWKGLALMLGLWVVPAAAQFSAPYNSEAPGGSPMPAEEALARLALPPGFRATLFAAEPAVQNPIALAWDARGRLWVAENCTYAERALRFDLSLRDRVLILEDKDHDGVAESRKVFTDDVQRLTSVEVGRGGVWLLCPPRLLFVPDADGDDVPDGPPQVMLDGFDVAEDNYHNLANGLRWGPDGWLYGRCGHSCPGNLGTPGTPEAQRVPIKGGIWRFHPERKVVEVLVHGTTNPWGHDWDAHGEGFFINTINGHLWHLIPGAHFRESGVDPNPGVYERIEMHADHWHFDTKGGIAGSRDGKANDFGGGHAHVGMMIYQGDQWPDAWRNKLFTLNFHGRRTNVERLEREGSGYVGRHEPDVFLSGDPWFRGMEISTGPDGSAYILDWSDTGECHERTGVHRTSGRIFKITYGAAKPPAFADLEALTPESVERLVKHPNVWFERQMRQKLASAAAGGAPLPGIASVLQRLLRDEADPVIRLRALWSLHAMSALTREQLHRLLEDDNEHLRVWALRLLTDDWPIDAITGPRPDTAWKRDEGTLAALERLARHDPSGLVKLTLASLLQRLPVDRRPRLAIMLAADASYRDDHNLPAMVWYGLIPLGDTDPMALVEVAAASRWPATSRWIGRTLAARIENRPQALDALIRVAIRVEPDLREALLRGIGDGLQGRYKAPKPPAWDELVARHGGASTPLLDDLSALFGDGRAWVALKKFVLDAKAAPGRRREALQTLIDSRWPGRRELCESLLGHKLLAPTAVRGLASFNDPEIGDELARRFPAATSATRAAIIDVLVTRPAWAAALLERIKVGLIPRASLTAYHVRQIRAFNEVELARELAELWGEVRASAADKRAVIDRLRQQLTPAALANADLGRGRQVFQAFCAACHTLYGEGGRIGPDLTGSGRANLDYLLENIVDPNAAIGADYRVTTVTLRDGRMLSGVISNQTDHTLTLRQLAQESAIAKAEIKSQSTAAVSMMPEGLLESLSPEQAENLLAYLMYSSQVPLPAGAGTDR